MPFDTAAVLEQIDNVLGAALVQGNARPDVDHFRNMGDAFITQQVTRIIAVVDRVTPEGSAYRTQVRDPFERGMGGSNPHALPDLIGVLQALRADVEAGYLRSVEELIHADVFADFLEMADELHGKGYKDPSAVIAGSVLEEHLRKLASHSGVEVSDDHGRPVKADKLNADLAGVSVYNKLEQKSITAWLDLRNKAAHGKYGEYDDGQVAALIRDVRDFMIRHPA